MPGWGRARRGAQPRGGRPRRHRRRRASRRGGTALGMRLLAVFAFLQTMNLLIWVVFFPRYAPDSGADLGSAAWLTGARLGDRLLAAALFAVLLVSDYRAGRCSTTP